MIQLGEEVTLSVCFTHALFNDNGFSVIGVYAEYKESLFPFTFENKNVEFIAKGQILVPTYNRQQLELTGEWVRDTQRGGYCFSVRYAYPLLPHNEKQVSNFLASIPGVGNKTISNVLNGCNCKVGFPITKKGVFNYELIAKAAKEERKGALIENAIRRIVNLQAVTRLIGGCASGQTIADISEKYAEKACDVARNLPYKMFFDRTVSFSCADTIAIFLGHKPEGKERIQAGIYAQVRDLKLSTGSIIVKKTDVLFGAVKALQLPEEEISTEFKEMMRKKDPLVSAAEYCYTREDYLAERGLGQAIAKYAAAKQTVSANDTMLYLKNFEKWERSNKTHLAERQEDAVKAVANNMLTVITGGPGTGKTTTLKAIIDTYRRTYPAEPITLMAPTGLAAKRMSEACGVPALTIHKTLGLLPSDNEAGFDDAIGLNINGGLVVVDEMSMVGIHLANFLFNAIVFNLNTRVVLVGDVDQLPPVSAGAVLEEIIGCGCVTVTRLDRNFRQEAGSAIVDAAYAINGGNTNLKFGGDLLMKTIHDDNIETETRKILESVKKAFSWSVGKYGEHGTYVLTPKRRNKTKAGGEDDVETMLSTAYMNPILRDIVNPPSSLKMTFKSGQKVFREGDRVVNLKNTDEVLNGEIGYIKKIEKSTAPTLTVEFEDGSEVTYTPDRLKEIDWAYALTVHKSQGCEYDSVIYPTSMTHGIMLQRNLLYTAVTRAKKSVAIIGSEQSLKAAISTVKDRAKKDLLVARVQKYYTQNNFHSA